MKLVFVFLVFRCCIVRDEESYRNDETSICVIVLLCKGGSIWLITKAKRPRHKRFLSEQALQNHFSKHLQMEHSSQGGTS